MDRLLPWIRKSSFIWLGAVVLLGLAARQIGSGGGQPETSGVPVAERVVSEPKEYLVHVAGAVRRPGVYRIGGDGRVIQAIRLAGGPTGRANLDGVNLAAPVNDGQQIVVPAKPTQQELATAPGATKGRSACPAPPSSNWMSWTGSDRRSPPASSRGAIHTAAFNPSTSWGTFRASAMRVSSRCARI